MTKSIIIIILLICIYIIIYNTEGFTIFNPVNENTPNAYYTDDNKFTKIIFPSNENTLSIYQNRFNFIPVTVNKKLNNNDNQLKSNKCCLVKKELNENNFKYTFTKYTDSECNINNFILDHNNQLLFDGINNWNNNECKDNTTYIGSCKHNNFECIDFVDNKSCNNYNNKVQPDNLNRRSEFIWSNKPCYSR